MSPLEAAVVRRKLGAMLECLALLKPLVGLDAAAWRRDADRRDAAERRLQVCIEAAIDVNAHLLVAAGRAAPADAFQSFLDVAAQAQAIPEELARRLAPSAGLRNRLVHRYDELDPALVLAGIADAVRLYPDYVQAVSGYLRRAAGGA